MMKYAILFNVCGIVPPFVLLFLGRIFELFNESKHLVLLHVQKVQIIIN